MIADLLENNDPRKIDLVFGVRHQDDFFSYQIFSAWQEKYENFNFHPTLSKPGESWDGLKGRVTKVVPEIFKDMKNKEAYICGVPQMVTDMQNVLLELGCEKGQIHIEKY